MDTYFEAGVSKLKMKNQSGTVCCLECYYKVNKDDSPKRIGKTGKFGVEKSKTLDLKTLGIPENAWVTAFANISKAIDENGNCWLRYARDEDTTAQFELTGTSGITKVTYKGLSEQYINEGISLIKLNNLLVEDCLLGFCYKVNEEDKHKVVEKIRGVTLWGSEILNLTEWAIPANAWVTVYVSVKNAGNYPGIYWFRYAPDNNRMAQFTIDSSSIVVYNSLIQMIPFPNTQSKLDFSSLVDDNDARRGLVEDTELTEPIVNKDKVVWDMRSYINFMQGDTPATVNRVVWRQEKLNNYNGIFQVLPKVAVENGNKGGKEGTIYQLRSFDLATMTMVKSVSGWIIIDPLGGIETVQEGWKRFENLLGESLVIRSIIITHSHVDHYKGIEGLIDKAKIYRVSMEEYDRDRKIPEGQVLVVAPDGFYDEAISENLYLGNCMSRRAIYMYGSHLERNANGHIGSGLGKTVSATSGTLLEPSFELVMKEGYTTHALEIDGVKVVFQDAPGTEAPAEFHVYFPEYGALCPGENVTRTMHNLLTPRGAKVRDPKAFAQAIDFSIREFGCNSDYENGIAVIIGTHHFPFWGNCIEVMKKQRDLYRFFNDQVIRLINKGMNMEEIAEVFVLPETLDAEFYNRGYYGTINHNVKAVVQRYVGWWDGNPANYFKYPDTEAAQRFVECMGGERQALDKARGYFLKGDYRWTVELTKQVVFCNSKNQEARFLQAEALTQLAFSFEAATWRNIFLSAAQELRGNKLIEGLPHEPDDFIAAAAASLRALTPEYAFEYLSTLVDGFKEIADIKKTIEFIDAKMMYTLYFENNVLHYEEAPTGSTVDVSYGNMDKFATAFETEMIYVRKHPLNPFPDNGLYEIYQYLDVLDGQWNIVEPL